MPLSNKSLGQLGTWRSVTRKMKFKATVIFMSITGPVLPLFILADREADEVS